jgi:hypothetical protein
MPNATLGLLSSKSTTISNSNTNTNRGGILGGAEYLSGRFGRVRWNI